MKIEYSRLIYPLGSTESRLINTFINSEDQLCLGYLELGVILLGLDGVNYKRKIAMTEPTKEQIMSALNDYNENYTKVFDGLPDGLKDEVHGVNYSRGMDSNEIIGFMCGYLAAKKSDFEEIKTLKEQLESANAVIHHVVYSTEDSQCLAYGYLEENSLLKQNKEINNEK